ncbi:MAG: thioredoxin domain-containing protein [Polyangiaceae bacterium]|nr:thioredoxin domain-containing protein [Polyangiaceae bacterium]
MSLSVGQTVIGRYRVEAVRELGPGVQVGQGVSADGAPVTLVAVRGVAHGECERALEGHQRYRIGARGIARPVGVGLEGEELVVAYERSLTDALVDRLGASAADTGNVLTQIATALGPLHDQGIAFGLIDANLIRVGAEGVSLEGFALEALVRELGGGRVSIVPPGHRAPEHEGASPEPATPASDVFALGVLATELLIGRSLRPADARPTPRACGVDVSDAVEALIGKAVARSPAARPMDVARWAQELAEALLRPHVPLASAPEAAAPVGEAPPPWVAPEPVAAPPAPRAPAPAPRPPPPRDSLPPGALKGGSALSLLALIGGGLLILLGVGGVFAYSLFRTPPPVATTATATTVVTPPPPPGPAPPPAETPGPDAAAELDAGEPAGEPDGALPPPNTGPRVALPADGLSPLPVTADVPVWGSDKALVTVIVFGDLECPHTRRAQRGIESVLRAFPNEVRVAFRHRPLAIHSRARDAAKVGVGMRRDHGEAAFWRFLSQAAATTHDANKIELAKWVAAAGGSAARVEDWIADAGAENEVGRDLLLAALFDVRETPTFFVNGLRVDGFSSYDDLKRVVEKELASARSLLALGTAATDLYGTRVRKNLLGLGKDVAERSCPPVGTSPVRGAADALVTIVEFSEFECPFCKRAQPTLDTLLARHGGDLRIVWKNFPLDHHQRARAAAAFALEVFDQGGATKFWKAHDLLFAAQSDLGDPALESIAGQLGLPAAPLLGAAKARANDPKIDADARLGHKLGVRGTPAFFINGRSLSGAQPLEKFEALIKEELESARGLVSGGTPRARVYDALCGVR